MCKSVHVRRTCELCYGTGICVFVVFVVCVCVCVCMCVCVCVREGRCKTGGTQGCVFGHHVAVPSRKG